MMSRKTFILLHYALILIARLAVASRTESDCDVAINYSANQQTSGVITSPGYPQNYYPGTLCRYRFHGNALDGASRIQIAFIDFDLRTPSISTGTSEKAFAATAGSSTWMGVPVCDQVDHVRISFIPASESAHTQVNQRQPRFEPLKFCGRNRPPQIMSPTPFLEMVFLTEPDYTLATEDGSDHLLQARGYKFHYQFVQESGQVLPTTPKVQVQSSDQGVPSTSFQDVARNDGEATSKQPTGCEFHYRSVEGNNGSFSTPNHPGYYPRNITCYYIFVGQPHERVMLTFAFFDVRGAQPDCAEGDYVQFEYLHSLTPSILGVMPKSTKSDHYCGTRRPHGSIFSARSPYLRVIFHSNGRDDGRGFDAYYHFVAANEAEAQQIHRSGARKNYLELPLRAVVCSVVLIFLGLF